jgi:hypothetical protein
MQVFRSLFLTRGARPPLGSHEMRSAISSIVHLAPDALALFFRALLFHPNMGRCGGPRYLVAHPRVNAYGDELSAPSVNAVNVICANFVLLERSAPLASALENDPGHPVAYKDQLAVVFHTSAKSLMLRSCQAPFQFPMSWKTFPIAG